MDDGGMPDAGVVIDPGSDRGCGPGSASGRSNTTDPVRIYAEKDGLATLERLVGQYVGGSGHAYRGMVKAHADESAFGQPDVDIPQVPAVAEIASNDSSWVLFLTTPSAPPRYITLQQL